MNWRPVILIVILFTLLLGFLSTVIGLYSRWRKKKTSNTGKELQSRFRNLTGSVFSLAFSLILLVFYLYGVSDEIIMMVGAVISLGAFVLIASQQAKQR